MNTLTGWLGFFLPGALAGWALRGIWIGRKAKNLIDDAELDAKMGDHKAALARLERAGHILQAL